MHSEEKEFVHCHKFHSIKNIILQNQYLVHSTYQSLFINSTLQLNGYLTIQNKGFLKSNQTQIVHWNSKIIQEVCQGDCEYKEDKFKNFNTEPRFLKSNQIQIVLLANHEHEV